MNNTILLIYNCDEGRNKIRMNLEKSLINVEIHEIDYRFDINEKIRELNVSMCIVDVMTPKKDGFKILVEIKKDSSVKDVPVIICTGINENETIEKVLELGAYDYISKPLNSETLKISLPLKVRNAMELMKRIDEIKYLSYYDALTGLYNRRFYEAEIKRLHIPKNLPMTIVMADINGLKRVNDTFGHSVGDKVLIKAAEVFKKHCRNTDILARWGGDEFVILLPNTGLTGTQKIINKIKDEFLDENVRSLKISISFGMETMINEKSSINTVLKNSENFMYKNKMMVKESGRSLMITAMNRSLNEKNPREKKHSERVSEICVGIGLNMKLSELEVNELRLGGLLHDIGKIALEEDLLNKPGKLTKMEWENVKRHPSIGYRILSGSEEMRDIAELALYHHERWDGKGYPIGVAGVKIPLLARIIAVADTFDAITSERTYRDVISNAEAIEEIKRCSGTQFDPQVVDVFVNNFFIDKVTERLQLNHKWA